MPDLSKEAEALLREAETNRLLIDTGEWREAGEDGDELNPDFLLTPAELRFRVQTSGDAITDHAEWRTVDPRAVLADLEEQHRIAAEYLKRFRHLMREMGYEV